ncbi:hypothetical protein SAMN05660235_02273 [Sporolituus thermophilus DSM 23256]|uniref:Uncharacterized protein n=1 Tax=Sporolituus thermophilus DSM 23256 TaxID=1123285 RepID=A0A1G7MTV4_9FIRM|nr:hypothetical protein SAMN05660235_02273 [Sporolituus thermophilus DSM 23256]
METVGVEFTGRLFYCLVVPEGGSFETRAKSEISQFLNKSSLPPRQFNFF